MSLFPVIVVFGLSFPPIFFELLLSLAIFWLVRRVLVPTGIYDFVWHLYTTKVNMSLFPVIVVFGLSFPPIFFELLLSLAIFWLVRRVLVPTGIYDFVWHPALFNTALYCCLFYLISRLLFDIATVRLRLK